MLDTNIASEIIRQPFGRASERARSLEEAVCVSIIVAAELRYGCVRKGSAELSRRVAGFLSVVRVIPFGIPADQAYGAIRAELESAGQTIGPNNLLIAAHARSMAATIVTANVREFQRVQGLVVENWLV